MKLKKYIFITWSRKRGTENNSTLIKTFFLFILLPLLYFVWAYTAMCECEREILRLIFNLKGPCKRAITDIIE